MLKMAKEPSRVSFIVDLNLFLIIFNLLNKRAPEHFVAIIARPMCSAMSTFGNVAEGLVNPLAYLSLRLWCRAS